jgi:hypothetical protein
MNIGAISAKEEGTLSAAAGATQPPKSLLLLLSCYPIVMKVRANKKMLRTTHCRQ